MISDMYAVREKGWARKKADHTFSTKGQLQRSFGWGDRQDHAPRKANEGAANPGLFHFVKTKTLE